MNDASDVDGQPARTVSDAPVARSACHLIGWSVSLLAASAAASPCPGGRFLVQKEDVVSGRPAASARAVVIAPSALMLEGLCGPGPAKLHGTARRTHVTATWRSCGDFHGKARLEGRIGDACNVLHGRFVVPKAGIRTDFVATRSRCGDGVLDVGNGEICDDGNRIDGDGCNADCTPSRCGDRILEPGEQCDDGNTRDGDGCNHACRSEFCGDGIRQPNEECDDGNFVFGDGCSNCRLPRCGNGFREGVEQCDGTDLGAYGCQNFDADGGLLACKPNCTFDLSGCQFCGNGRREGTERCDGADVGGETCASQRYPEGGVLGCQNHCISFDTRGCFICGNGVKEGREACDFNDFGGQGACDAPGERGGHLACTADCRVSRAPCWVCGNGRLDPGEYCDRGARNGEPDFGCSTGCQSLCGDGFLASDEECDDGNRQDGDGCSRFCGNEHSYAGGGNEPYDQCFMQWNVEGVTPAARVACRDGDAACDRGTDAGACTFLYFLSFNDAFVVLPGPSPPACYNAKIATVALTGASIDGPAALATDDVDHFLAMVAHVLERAGSTVTRDDGTTTLTVDPPNGHLGVCASSMLTVPVDGERVLEVVVTDAATAAVDRDRITFACHP